MKTLMTLIGCVGLFTVGMTACISVTHEIDAKVPALTRTGVFTADSVDANMLYFRKSFGNTTKIVYTDRDQLIELHDNDRDGAVDGENDYIRVRDGFYEILIQGTGVGLNPAAQKLPDSTRSAFVQSHNELYYSLDEMLTEKLYFLNP